MSMYPPGPSRPNWMPGAPPGWTGQWPPPYSSFGGAKEPMSYPQPPPMPNDYAYGPRAWKNGSWMYANGGPHGPGAQRNGWRPFPGFGRPQRNQQSSDYWATELKDNPLGLENMHIRADDQAKENEPPTQGTNQARAQENLVWVPALQDNSSRSRPATRQSGSRSSSQPPLSRVPHPTGNRDHLEPPMTAHPRPRAPTPTKPIFNSVGRSDAYETQGEYEIPQYQRKRPSSAGAYHHYYHPEPRRKSDEYIGYEGPRSGRSSVPADRTDRYPPYPESFGLRSATMDFGAQHRHRSAQATVGGRSVQRSQTLPMNFSIPEDRQANGPFGLNITHTAESVDEYEDQKTEMAKSKTRVLKWLEQSSAAIERVPPTKRQTAEGYEHLRSPGREQAFWESPSQGRHQIYGHSRDDMARKEALGRNHSLPAAFAPGVGHITEMNDITEEPSDMMSRTLVEDSSSEGNTDDDDDDNESEMFRPVLQRQKTPLPTQRPSLDRNDTLRVDDERAYHQPLPSPKSLHPSSGQSSRIPSARSSYERVGEGGRVATPNRHHLSPASSQQFQGAMSYNTPPRTPNRPDYMYRQDESRAPMSAPAAIRSGAYSAPNAAAEPSPLRHADRNVPRSGGAHPSPGSFQTPPHLQYLYRQSASPSPQARQPASAASNASHHTVQPQYGHGATLSADKNLPPRPTRSPSPRPPSVAPLAPQTTGHHSSSRSQHGATLTTRQAEQPQDQISSRSGGHGRSPLAPRPQLSGRHIRSGFWNRRGDHLTKDGFVVSCPPGRNYPPELANYPDVGFMDHLGNRVAQTPDKFPEHPDSLPVNGRPAKSPYEHFLNYVMQ